MNSHFVLLDFENLQPKSLGSLSSTTTHVRVFAGASQGNVALGLAQALQPLGTNVEYIQIVGSGKDALDFHIAFYIGELAAKHAGATFTIVSKDTGFDPLIKHLVARGIQCKRVASLGGSAEAKAAKPKPPAKKAAKSVPEPSPLAAKSMNGTVTLSTAITRLKGMNAARPKTMKTLGSSIKSWAKPPLSPAEVDSLLAELRKSKTITVAGTKVSYTF